MDISGLTTVAADNKTSARPQTHLHQVQVNCHLHLRMTNF